MKFNNYKEFEENILTDRLLLKFSPLTRNELLKLVKLISNNSNKDIDWLYAFIIKNKKLPFNELFDKLNKELKI